MDDIKQALLDFIATREAKPELSEQELLAKFPELQGEGKLQAAFDYEATYKSGKYDEATLDSKFPEFFDQSQPVKKKDNGQPLGAGQTVGETLLDPVPELAEEFGGQPKKEGTSLVSKKDETQVGDSESSRGEKKKKDDKIDYLVDYDAMSKFNPENQSFIDKKFGQGMRQALSSIMEVPTYFTEQMVTLFAPDEVLDKLNNMEYADRKKTVQAMGDNLNPLNLLFGIKPNEMSSQKSEELRQTMEKVNNTFEQYETTIGQDFANGNIGAAAKRTAGEVIQTIPSIMQAMIPYAGIASITAGAAAEKSRSLQEDDNQKLGLSTSANALVWGTAEGLLELTTKKIGNKLVKSFKGTADDATELVTNMWKEIAKSTGAEVASEEATFLSQTLSDYLFLGKEKEFNEMFLEMVDIAIISAGAGGGMSIPTQVKTRRNQKQSKKIIDKTVENSKYDTLADAFKDTDIDTKSNIDQITLAGKPYSRAWLDGDLKKQVKAGEITQKEYESRMRVFDATKKSLDNIKSSGNTYTDKKVEEIVNLMKERDMAQNAMEKSDPAFKDKYKQEVEEINEKIKAVPTKDVVDRNNTEYKKELSQYRASLALNKEALEKGEITQEEADVLNKQLGERLTDVQGELGIDKADFKVSARNKTWDTKAKENLQESTFKTKEELETTIKEGEWGMLTAENPDASQITDVENLEANERAKAWLADRGYSPQQIFGKYGNSENSFFVEGLTRKDAVDFARQFNQESVATNEGLVYQDGTMNPRTGEAVGVEQDNFYSTIKTAEGNINFAVDYDFDNKVDTKVADLKEADELAELVKREAKETQEKVMKQIKNVVTALQSIAPDVKIKVYKNDDRYDAIVGNEGSTSAAQYNPVTKTISINMNRADGTTLSHEAFHAILSETIKSEAGIQEATKQMLVSVSKGLPVDMRNEVLEFIRDYDSSIQSEEALSQVVGILANNYQNLTPPSKNIVKRWLEKLAKFYGFKNFTDAEVFDLLNTISKGFSEGTILTEQDVEPLVKFRTAIPLDTRPQEHIRHSMVMDALEKKELPLHPNAKVQKNVPLKKLDGKMVSTTLSDKLFAGTMGNFRLLGGVGYPTATGRYWAASKIGNANKIVNESIKDEDGYRYLLPAIMSDISHMSNVNMTNVTLDLIAEANANGEVNFEKFKKDVISAFKKKKTKKNLPEAKKIVEEAKNVNDILIPLRKLMTGDKMIFESRKDALQTLIGESKVNKPKYRTVGTFSQLAKSLTDPRVENTGLHQVISAIRTKGDLKVVKTPKSDEFYHESYPYHVESTEEVEVIFLDGAYNLTEIIPEFTKDSDGETISTLSEINQKLGKPKGDITWTESLILGNLGRTHGLASYSAPIKGNVSPVIKKQRTTDNIRRIIRIAKKHSVSDSGIVSYLKNEGFTDAQIQRALDLDKDNLKRLEMFNLVQDSVNEGMSDAEIIEEYDTEKEKSIVKSYITRARGLTPEEAFNKFTESWEKAKKEQSRVKQRDKNLTATEDLLEKAMVETVDRQFIVKKVLTKAGFQSVVDFIVVNAGASSSAKNIYDKAYDKVYLGLNDSQLDDLDAIIHLRRIISVDENRDARGLPPKQHQGDLNGKAAEDVLRKIEDRLGVDTYSDLLYRSIQYFDTYKGLLLEMKEEGMIDERTYEEFAMVDYQPTQYIEYLENLDGEFQVEALRRSENVPLSKEQIKTMNIGSTSSQITDTKYLLQRTILTRSKGIFNNRLNNVFATEYSDQSKVVQRLRNKDPKKLTKEDKTIIENFERVERNVIEDTVKFDENGMPSFELESSRMKGYSPLYYYKDGVKNRVWMKDEFFESFTDTQEQYVNAKAREAVSILTGSASVKTIATGNNPLFFITNIPRDFAFVVAFSKEYGGEVVSTSLNLVVDATKGVVDVMRKGKDYNKYIEYGGGMDYLAVQGKYKGTGFTNKLVDKVMSQKSQDRVTRNVVKKMIDRFNLASEVGMRVAVFNKSIKNQLKSMGVKDIESLSKGKQTEIYTKAVRSARELTDFSQGGKATKALDAAIPYLNAATQGTRSAMEKFSDRKLETTVRIAQMVGYSTAAFVGLGASIIGKLRDNDDEEIKELTNSQIYFKTIEGVSDYDLRNYYIIPKGTRDENGNWDYYRMAKQQALTPIINVVEEMVRGAVAKSGGINYKVDLTKKAMEAVEHNILPFELDIKSPVMRMPMVDMAFALSGIDGFTGQPLSWDKGSIPAELEGIVDDRVEPFYKTFGELSGVSPVRFKSAVEAYITTPSTNPYIGIAYGVGNMLTSSVEIDETIGNFGADMEKAMTKRFKKTTSEYNVLSKIEARVEPEIVDAVRSHIIMEDKVKKAARDLKQGNTTVDEVTDLFFKNYEKDPILAKKSVDWFKSEIGKTKKHPLVNSLKFQTDKKVRAIILNEYYGNTFVDPQNLSDDEREILKDLFNENVLDRETLIYYGKLHGIK